ncbi:MAG: peptidoglycan-binding protein [Leptospiraceae bacterium]|nr:MAG: peptidoglycan-binding protein [Leptospiraceae bacterium]
MKYTPLVLLFLFSSLYSNQIENPTIEIQKLEIIKDLDSDQSLQKLREEIKKNLKLFHNVKNINIYEYTLKQNEDFYYLMAKTYQDHTSLLSLNQILNHLSVEDYKKNTKVYIPDCRGFFSEKPIKNNNKYIVIYFKSMDKTLYFYPNQKEFYLFHRSFQNKSDYLSNSDKEYLFPLPYDKNRITSHFGWRINPFTGKKEFHKGIDIKAKFKTPVHAPVSGIIVFAGYKKGYGKTIILRNKDEKFLFAHLHVLNVKIKDRVKQGDIIAYTGRTGKATGPHLHLEFIKGAKYKNPILIFQKYF